MSKVFLSVVIPSFDEMTNLQKGVLDKIEHFLEKKKFEYEVIVVDDGSKDGSREFVERFTKENPRFKLISGLHMGKGGAVTTGVLEAQGEYVLFSDMDQATPIEEVGKLLPFFDEGYDVVIGSRSQRRGSPFTRKLMSKSVIILRSLLVGLPTIKDTQCGFKMFTKKAAKDLFTRIKMLHNGFKKIEGSSVTAGFDVELLYLAQKYNYKIKEVPVEWLYVETRRVSPIKDSIEGLMELIRIRMNISKGAYK